MNNTFDVLIVGGGAAGFFTAINLGEGAPHLRISILERGNEVLSKVKVSGGGRCNVTHGEFDPRSLAANYPRGEKELLGPFHKFMTADTIEWFESRGVELKIEDDGRMFPVSDSSSTIINCFSEAVDRLGVDVLKGHAVKAIDRVGDFWQLTTAKDVFLCRKLIIATGSNTKIWKLLSQLGHTIVEPVPSLFTFNVKDSRIADLPGIVTQVSVHVLNENGKMLLESEGPLLITHWGFSGPAILKLSSWGARILQPTGYRFTIRINWLVDLREDEVLEALLNLKKLHPKQSVHKYPQFELPKRLWQNLVRAIGLGTDATWAEISKIHLQNLANQLTRSQFEVEGKSTFKEEFVTAGGVDLREVNFKTFGSKLYENLYFAGEVLNIDAITGGFNFQNAWTGGFLVAKALTKEL